MMLLFFAYRLIFEEFFSERVVRFRDEKLDFAQAVDGDGIDRLNHRASKNAGDAVTFKQALDDLSLYTAHDSAQFFECRIFFFFLVFFVFHRTVILFYFGTVVKASKFLAAEIIVQNLLVVKGQGTRDILSAEDAYFLGIILSFGLAFGSGDKNGGDGMETGVAAGLRVRMKLGDNLDAEGGFFFGFAYGGFFKRLAVVHKSAGKSPAVRRIFSLDEDNARFSVFAFDFDDNIYSREWVFMLGQVLAIRAI